MSALAPAADSNIHVRKTRRNRSSLRILVVDGHPREDSLGDALAASLHRGAASRAEECRMIRLRALEFDLRAHGHDLDPTLSEAQRDILWAEVIVFVYPTWWGTTPALLKAFLDRILHPGFAFAERSDGGWKGLLDGRAALLVTTMDTPRWIYRWLLGAPGHRAMRDATLGFCGISPVKILSFGPVRSSTLAQRRKWLARAAAEGRRLEATFRTGWRVRLRAWLAVSRLHFYVQPWLTYTLGALAVSATFGVPWQWPAYLLGYATIFLIEFITVATNELEDQSTDRINEHASALTGGSRVLVSGRLAPAELRRGRGGAMALLALLWVLALVVVPQASLFVAVGFAGLVLGLAYSAPPIRLCARGLGELDVAVTHSFLVILAGIASQGGPLHSSIAWLLAGPLGLAVLPSITLAGFPDFEADAATGKRTLAVRLGRRNAAIFAGTCALVAAILPIGLTGGAYTWLWWTSVPAIPHALWLCWFLRRYIRAGTPAGRIDVLLIIGLNFMLWFCLVPIVALLLRVT